MTYELNGLAFTDKEMSFSYLREIFDLPEYTGHNLDALWDVLLDLEASDILIYNAREILNQLDDYGLALLNLFGDLHQESDHNVLFFW